MKMTKERKVYAAVLGLGVTILTVDRVFLGGTSSPAAATAAPTAVQDLAVAPSGPVSPPTPVVEPEHSPALAGRLNSMRGSLPAASLEAGLFSTSSNWLKPLEPEKPLVRVAAGPSLAEVVAQHKITGVVLPQGAPPIVMVDGQRLSLGSVLDGARIVKIEKNAVTFERDGQSHTVTLYEAPDRPINPAPARGTPHDRRVERPNRAHDARNS